CLSICLGRCGLVETYTRCYGPVHILSSRRHSWSAFTKCRLTAAAGPSKVYLICCKSAGFRNPTSKPARGETVSVLKPIYSSGADTDSIVRLLTNLHLL